MSKTPEIEVHGFDSAQQGLTDFLQACIAWWDHNYKEAGVVPPDLVLIGVSGENANIKANTSFTTGYLARIGESLTYRAHEHERNVTNEQ
ncbi:hypothetical protein [Corynebacterium lubricantis]|uniref:hypothetical protein n=1 Tax=Corynebacterium lubricantis TaxID=541095 RepID=UPI00037CDB87|nr:hypothetical protein [Corynebacterium lubricantis]